MQTISSNAFSTDLQMMDALQYLKEEHPEVYKTLLEKFPELENPIFDDSWLDYEVMGLDVEYSMFVIDAIEQTGYVIWEEGEPWATTP